MKSYSPLISLGLGFFSLIVTFSLWNTSNAAMLIPCLGSLAAIAGFFIGVFVAVQSKNESPLMRYGGVCLNCLGLFNIIFWLDAFLKKISMIN